MEIYHSACHVCGNTVVWKCANTGFYSAQMFMRILGEAGLPDGVINLVYVKWPVVGEVCFNHKEFAGVHFTGSTGFSIICGKRLEKYGKVPGYPRIVGETGGKDFVMVHKKRKCRYCGSYCFVAGRLWISGAKCSAASRAYISSNLWAEVKT